jgi:hypothetical protein
MRCSARVFEVYRILTLREAALVPGVLPRLARTVRIDVVQNGDRPYPGIAVRTPLVPEGDGAFLEPQSA